MNEDFPEKAETRLDRARKSLAVAVQEFGEAKAEQLGYTDAYVNAFALYGEYISTELVQNDATVGFVAVPSDQHGSTSRGLFEFGAEAFSRLTVRTAQ